MRDTDLAAVEALVGRHYPMDGPYDPDLAAHAARVIAELVRYLNYATAGRGASDAVPWPNTVEQVLSGLTGAVGRMDQTLRQLAERCQQLAQHPGLYDYTRRADREAAVAHAHEATAALTDAVRAAYRMRVALQHAGSQLNYLGIEEGR